VRFVCRRQARLSARGEAGDPGFDAAYRRYYERTVLIGSRAAARREQIIRAGRAMAPLLHRAWLGFGEPEADLRAWVPRVVCPVLIAWTKRDRVIPWAFSRAAARRFMNHRVQRFEGSHAAFLESPEAFDRALLDFVASLPEPAAGSARAD
jgi:pimeloyl-ACP methyl ester carboxylesterase